MSEPVAITGIGCRLPGGAIDFSTAWHVFREGKDAVGQVPPDRWDAAAVARTVSGRPVPSAGAFLAEVDRFDADLFGISPREARAMDPQQRLLLEVAWEALEDAGQPPDALQGSPTGVFVGMGLVDWARRTFASHDPQRLDAWSGTGAFDSVLAGRIAYCLGLTGPAMAIHTACSSSLVAIHLAARALRQGECERALAGGVNLLLSPEPTVYFAELAALSPTGRCRTFDAAADGYVRGEGVGLLVLRRLSDALRDGDHIYGLLLGSAVNQDGRSNGLTAPSGKAQQQVIRAALADAELAPARVGYVEAHGTGTPLGDPIEVAALASVFGAGPEPLYVGSAKTQVGHLEAAAGVAGLIRALGALREGFIPPHLHFERLNPRISLQGTRLSIPTGGAPWEGEHRIASVSSFGLSGTNAHVVLGPPPAPDRARRTFGGPALLAISGPTEAQALARWAQVQQAHAQGLRGERLARAASAGRALHRHRIAVVLDEDGALPDAPAIAVAKKAPSIVFAFTGQGSQQLGMGRELYETEPVYREALDEVAALYREQTGRDLLSVMFGQEPSLLDETRYTQPALFALQWALTRLLASWGVHPDAVLGHSIGEMVAAAVAGVATLPQAVAMVAARAELLAELPPGGAMVAVHAPWSAVEPLLGDREGIDLAAINAPDEVVLSGEAEPLMQRAAALQRAGLRTTALQVSHAFHSHRVEAAGPALAERIDALGLVAPKLPLYSALEGTEVSEALTTGAFWRRHLREPVRFVSAVEAAVEDGHDLFVEIGPRAVLTGLGARIAPQTAWLPALRGRDSERSSLLELLGALFQRGVRLDLRGGMGWWSHDDKPAFPPYPFVRQRHWIEPSSGQQSALPGRYRLIEETRPYRPGEVGAWRVSDAALAQAIERAGGIVSDEAPRALRVIEEPRDLLGAVQALQDPSLLRLQLVVRSEGAVADAVRGFLACASLEVPALGGLLVGADEDVVRALASGDDEDVVTALPEGRRVPRLVPVHGGLPEVPSLDPERWVLITGGTGALGLALASWLVDLGARKLLLVSRRGEADRAVLQDLRARGAEVALGAADTTDEQALARLLAGRPLLGIVHAAGISEPSPALALDERSLLRPYRVKRQGAELLDALTAEQDLQFFVLISSIAGVWGSPGLSAYGAGNRAMHALARERRRSGRPASVLALGPLALDGMVSRQERARFDQAGVRSMAIDRVLAVLGTALGPDAPLELVIADVDWERAGPLLTARRPKPLLERVHVPSAEPSQRQQSALSERVRATPEAARRPLLLEELGAVLARVLGRDPSVPLDPGMGLFDLGLDSAMAVELAQRLRALTGLPLPATVAFDHPTLEALVELVLRELSLVGPEESSPLTGRAPRQDDEAIAIVGLACRFPGADTPEAYWALLEQGREAVGLAPAGRFAESPDPALLRAGWLEDIGSYEPDFFGIGPAEAPAVDPQQRLVLEVAWEALERAGIAPDTLVDSRTALFVGAPRSEYWDRLHDPAAPEVLEHYPWVGTGNESSFVAGRLAHLLGTRGPAVTLNTACSSSLVATHLAARALREGEVDLALAGGVNVLWSAESSEYLSRIGALSRSGHCRAFDAAADGYVRGEGCGFVVLKRLSDALRDGDRVLAVLRGSATGHDGRSSGLGVPNGTSQQEVIRAALRAASVAPEEIAVLEAHGTGTPLGDPIELGAVASVLGQGRSRPLVVTAGKSNLGHLETAAGIAGLIKLVLALQHGRVPGIVGLTEANPALPTDFPYLLAKGTLPWPEGRRLAAISSFGISGTTAHVILEAYERPAPAEPVPADNAPQLLLLSAHTAPALQQVRAGVTLALQQHPADEVASTLAHGRAARRWRMAVAGAPEALSRALLEAMPCEVERPARVGLLFTGQGAQQQAMLAALSSDRRLAVIVERLLALCPDPVGLRRVLFEQDPAVDDTRWTQPALVLLELALAEWFSELGLEPVVVLGHSIGEVAAAAVAGILSAEDALALAFVRGQAMAEQPRDGAMAALRGSEGEIRALLPDSIEIAAFNAPDEVVVAGPRAALEPWLAGLGAEAKELRTSHAFHSAAMEGALPAIEAIARQLSHRPAAVPLASGLDGRLLSALEPGHWAQAVRAPVRFADALRAASERCDLFLELGPRPVLSGLAARVCPDRPAFCALSPQEPGPVALLSALGALWARGARLEVRSLLPRRPPVSLPTTPWQRTRHLLEPKRSAGEVPRFALRWVQAPDPGALPAPLRIGGDAALVERVSARLPVGEPAQRLLWCVRAGEGTAAVLDALSFVQSSLGSGARLTLLTRGAMSVAGEPADPAQAAVWGLIATLTLEHPELDAQIIDLPADGEVEGLPEALACGEPRVALREGRAQVPRLAPARALPLSIQDRVVVLTGGTGALGRVLVEALLERGARHVVVASRRPGSLPASERVSFVQADLCREEDAERLVKSALSMGPLLVVHAAGMASSGLLHDMGQRALAEVWGGKVQGALHLDRLLPDEVPLVAFSSAIGWLGRPGAGAYGAANAALDAVIAARRARGAAGLSMLWGPWALGMARDQDWSSEGVRPMTPEQGITALLQGGDGLVLPILADGAVFARRYVTGPPPWLEGMPGVAAPERNVPELVVRLGALPERERSERLQSLVSEVVGAVIGREALPPDQGLFDAGLDSLGAVEVARRLGARLGLALPSTVTFDHPDVRRLARHLAERLFAEQAPAAARAMATSSEEPIAIVGMACRFPGASSPEEFWELLVAGRVAIREVPTSRWRLDEWFDPEPGRPGKMYVREGGFLDDIEMFDPEFFGISPREAASLDPQQRLLLEVSWEALERAGLATASLRGSRTGVFAGISERHYLLRFQRPGASLYPDAWAGTGTEPSFAPGRIAFVLGLQGPVLALNTTCSSSLVATHLAVEALRRGECDQALAGGVSLMLLPDDTAYLCAMGALSPTGRCRTFDEAADGYVRGEGAGMVVLKRLSDALRDGNEVLAVIRGSSINHDGASSGLTVPNGAAQEAVLRAAFAQTGAKPEEVGFLETHGTGTKLGDPIEVRAALSVYGQRGSAPPLVLGAVKANLGHLELAAGMASLLKAVLVLQHRTIPPQPDFGRPNPEISFEGATIPQTAQPWPEGTRLAAVSGFGLSGTNAHLLLEAADLPANARSRALPKVPERPVHLLAVSAGSERALQKFAALLVGRGPLPDRAATLHRRKPLPFRAAVVASDEAEADRMLLSVQPRQAGSPRVAFLYSGQGSQYGGMGQALMESCPPFQQAMREYADVLDPLLGRPLAEVLRDDALLEQTEYTQPALMALELALTRTLRAWGLAPSVVAGHSLGELTAAAVAGVWSEREALQLAVLRGKLMAEHALPGAMVALGADVSVVERLLVPGVEIASVNAPDETVIAGSADRVELVVRSLPSEIAARRLKVSRPFHSSCVEPMLEEWERAVASVQAHAPELPLISLLTGQREDVVLQSPAFWRRHARERVRYTEGLQALVRERCDVLVEVGPHPVLLGLARRTLPDGAAIQLIPTLRRDVDAWRALALAVGGLFEAGLDPDWEAWDAPYDRKRVSLPTTPFDKRRFWLEEPAVDRAPAYTVVWEEDRSRGPLPRSVSLAGEHSGLGSALASRGIEVSEDGEWLLDARPLAGGDLQQILLSLIDGDERPRVVLTRNMALDPVQRAVWGFVRCWALERGGVPLKLLDIGDSEPTAIAEALSSAEPEVRLQSGRLVPRLVPWAPQRQAPRVSGRWLVTGGLGSIGLAIARWLAERGAGELVLVGRRALPPDDPRHQVLASIQRAGAVVQVVNIDASDEEALSALVTRLPPDGVVHCAGITEPQPIRALDPAVMARTLQGKVQGALHLDRLLSGRKLQGFVLLSSIAATWGSRDLAAYAAANALLDGLAAARAARGEPALALALGPVAGSSMVDASREAELARAGLVALPMEGILEKLGAALASGAAPASDGSPLVVVRADLGRLVQALELAGPRPLFDQVRPAPASSPGARTEAREQAEQSLVDRLKALPGAEREAALLPHLERRVREVMRLDPSRKLGLEQPISDLGFDSLMATELKGVLLADGLDIPLGRLLGGPSLEELAIMAVARLPAEEAPEAALPLTSPAPVAGQGRDLVLVWTHLAALIVGVGLASAVWALL